MNEQSLSPRTRLHFDSDDVLDIMEGSATFHKEVLDRVNQADYEENYDPFIRVMGFNYEDEVSYPIYVDHTYIRFFESLI